MFETDSTALDPTVDRCNVQRLPLTNETEPHEKRQSRPRLFTDKLRPDSVSVDVACTLMVRWSGCISHLNEACGNAGDTPSRVLLSTRVPSVPNCGYEAQRSKGGQSPSFARTCSSSIRRPSAPLPHSPVLGPRHPSREAPGGGGQLAVFHTQDHNHSLSAHFKGSLATLSRSAALAAWASQTEPFLLSQGKGPANPRALCWMQGFSAHLFIHTQATLHPPPTCKGPRFFRALPPSGNASSDKNEHDNN